MTGLCGNKVCDVEKGESYNKCPTDCLATGKDGVCSPTSGDGCDSDCRDLYSSGASAHDPDCGDCSYDGTKDKQCSTNSAGKYCLDSKLIDACGSPYNCGCPVGKVCPNGGTICIVEQDYTQEISDFESKIAQVRGELQRNKLEDQFSSETAALEYKIEQVRSFAREYEYAKADQIISSFESDILDLRANVEEEVEKKKKQTQTIFAVGILFILLAFIGIIVSAARRRKGATISIGNIEGGEKKEPVQQQVVRFYPVAPPVAEEGLEEESAGEFEGIEEDLSKAESITQELSKTAKEIKSAAKGVQEVEKTPPQTLSKQNLGMIGRSRRARELERISMGLKRVGEEIENRRVLPKRKKRKK